MKEFLKTTIIGGALLWVRKGRLSQSIFRRYRGPERAALADFANRHFAPDRVMFLGTSDRVPELLRAMDVFILPSLTEGICNSLLEAMASQTAVIATAVGGNPEVVGDASCGVLVADPRDPLGLADQLAVLCRDPGMRATLSDCALARVKQRFTIRAMTQAYGDVYHGIVRRAGSRLSPVER